MPPVQAVKRTSGRAECSWRNAPSGAHHHRRTTHVYLARTQNRTSAPTTSALFPTPVHTTCGSAHAVTAPYRVCLCDRRRVLFHAATQAELVACWREDIGVHIGPAAAAPARGAAKAAAATPAAAAPGGGSVWAALGAVDSGLCDLIVRF